MSADGILKTAVEWAATSLGPAGAAERRNREAVAVLSYHNIVPPGERPVGDGSLHLPFDRFARHLDCLSERYDVVSLDRLAEPADGTRPRVAITFDDAYAGAVVAGLDELARRDLPATVFVSAGMLDRATFWWDRLAGPDGSLAPDIREHALWKLAGADDAVRAWARREGLVEQDLPEHATAATAAELRTVSGRPGITLGSHGWGHRNFAALDPDPLDEELTRPLEALATAYPASRPWVAYPYGLTTDTVEARAAVAYELGFLVSGGLARPDTLRLRPRRLPRINVPAGLSASGLRMRVSGLLG